MTNKEGSEEEGAATCQGPAVAGVTKGTTKSVYTCRRMWGSPGASGSWVSFSGAASGLRDSRHKQVWATPTSQHGYGARGPEKRRDCAAQLLHKPAGFVHKTFAQNLCNTTRPAAPPPPPRDGPCCWRGFACRPIVQHVNPRQTRY